MSEKQGISKFAARAMLTYGHYTLFNRAVPEFRDGLKPVHRAAVWAAHTLGMNSKGKFHKCALLVGDVIGNYHPHGDCLRGDTVVPLLDGREVTIRELVEAGSPRKWVLAFDEAAGNYVPAVAHSWRVGQTTRKMYRVTFSTGETLEVTGNHPFYSLTRNKWVQARKLRSDEEVAGGVLTRNTYPALASNTSPRRPVHHIVGDFRHGGYDEDEVYHHINEKPSDNRPRNIDVITRAEHAEIHRDYEAGLAAGRTRMFEQEGRLRDAIAEKNSRLLKLHNESLWLIKAVKVARTLRDRGIRLTASSYESMRKEVYNLTRLSTLEARGIDIAQLRLLADTFKLDTSSSRGLTKHLHKKRNYAQTKSTGPEVVSNLYAAIAGAIRGCGVNSKWGKYRRCCSADNRDKTVYHDVDYLRSRFGIGTVRELATKIPANHLLLVRSVDVVELPEEEDFYDFTVDGLHNMIVRMQAGSENFVVVHNSSVYEATVGISGTRKEGKKEWTVRHCVAPLFEGYGNFGDFEDGPAAYRYTEARLSPIAEHLLLDPDYLAVTPMVMNYSGTKQMPLSLPAKLPLMMVNGGTTLAVGMSGGIPSYSVPDVLDLAIKALEGRVTNKDIAAKKPTSSYGGRCVSTTKDEPYRSYVLTGKGSVRYQPDYVVDERKRTITLTSVCVGLDKASSIVKFMTAVNDLPDVMRVVPSTGNGVYSIVIRCKPRGSDFEETLDKIVKLMTTSVSYDVVRLSRESEDEMSVAKLPILQLLTDWAAYRISLQTDVTNYRIQRVEQRVERIDLLIKAVDCLEIIMKSLRVDDSEAYLVRHMKVTPEQAHDILEMRVRQLKSLEKRKLLEERKACMTTLKTLRIDLKYPAKAAIRETVEAVDAIKKSGFL